MEEEIIQPISKELLKSELTPERMLRSTNKSHNEIYIVTAKTAPNVDEGDWTSARNWLSVRLGVVRANRWMSMSSTRWRIVVGS